MRNKAYATKPKELEIWHRNLWNYPIIRNWTFVFLFAAVALGCHGRDKTSRGRLDDRLDAASKSGETTISLPEDDGTVPAEANSIDNLLGPHDHVVVAHFVAYSASVNKRRDDLTSWYKLKIDRDLSKRPISAVLPGDSDVGVPANLLPVLNDEVVISARGGVMKIGSVAVTSGKYPARMFQPGKRYLVFVYGPIGPNRVAHLSLGTSSIFVVAEDGDRLSALNKEDGEPIQTDLNRRFHGRISELAGHIQEVP